MEEGVLYSTVGPQEVSVLMGENGKLGRVLANRRSGKECELWSHVDAVSRAGRRVSIRTCELGRAAVKGTGCSLFLSCLMSAAKTH